MRTAFQIVLLLLIVTSSWGYAETARAEGCLGFALPPGAKEVGINRYRLPMSWNQALQFYHRTYPADKSAVTSYRMLSLPQVVSMHFQNGTGKGSWEWANVSLIQNEVFVFCYSSKAAAKPR